MNGFGKTAFERRLPSFLLKVGGFLSLLSSAEDAVLVKLERSLELLNPNPVVRDLMPLG